MRKNSFSPLKQKERMKLHAKNKQKQKNKYCRYHSQKAH